MKNNPHLFSTRDTQIKKGITNNHPFLILNKYQKASLYKTHFKTNGKNNLFERDNRIDDKYVSFFKGLPYYVMLKDFILVHAGINTNAKEPFKDYDSMLWIRDFEYDRKILENRRVIHGHTPVSLEEIRAAVEKRDMIIPLDNGCVFNDEDGFGNLLCLNLDTFELLAQKKID